VRVNKGDTLSAFAPIVTFTVTQPGSNLTYRLDVPLTFQPVA
jgi:hypothetical protein